ncbi:MAG: hypothetical protein WD690_16190 [Vicinamibacterales bacterium]
MSLRVALMELDGAIERAVRHAVDKQVPLEDQRAVDARVALVSRLHKPETPEARKELRSIIRLVERAIPGHKSIH